jgi:hypothetical protein
MDGPLAVIRSASSNAETRRWQVRLGPGVVAALFVLGITARLCTYLSCTSYWYDEAYILLNVTHRTCGELLRPLDDQQAAPPLFLFLLRGLYLLDGSPEWLMRLPASVAGMAALALAVPLARQIVGRRGWVWAVGLCAVCHHAVSHSCEVKPYAFDLLFSELILLATATLLRRPRRAGRRPAFRFGRPATYPTSCILLVAGVLAPWLSYPSVFLLGAAGSVLLWDGWRWRSRSFGRTGAALCASLFLSVGALWLFVVRQQHTGYLEKYWGAFFPDLSSLPRALSWSVGYLVLVGHYGATGLGIPLMLLAILGWWRIGRRSAALLLLLVLPLVLAWLAAAVRVYPLGDRLVFFAAPCLWLPAAAGADAVVRRLRGRRAALAWVGLAGVLLAPGAVRMTKELAGGRTVPGFREAFVLAHQRMQPGDYLWVSHPQVYEVYFGHPDWLLGPSTPLERLAEVARSGRVWMICNPQLPGLTLYPDVFARLRDCGAVAVKTSRVEGLDIVLYTPGPAADSVAARSPKQ